MKKFFRGKLSAKLALVAILANTLTSPVGVIAEETTGEENQTPKISLQNMDTGGKDAVEPEENFNATLTGDFENLKETNTKAITFTLNSEFALSENPVSKTEGVKVVKLTDTNFSLDFSEVTEDKQNFAVNLPLTAKVDSANEDAQLVLSSDYTQDIAKTFKITKAPILTEQETAGKSDIISKELESGSVDTKNRSASERSTDESVYFYVNWFDNGNQTGQRPNSVKANLMQNGTFYKEIEYTGSLTESEWSASSERLPMTDEQNKPYEYTLEVTNLSGYTVVYDYSQYVGIDKVLNINLYSGSNREMTTFSGKVSWMGNYPENLKMDRIMVKVFQNGQALNSFMVGLDTAINTNTYQTPSLPKFDDDGNLYQYTIKASGYTLNDRSRYEVKGFDIEMHYGTVKNVTVKKIWDDSGNSANKRPDSIKLQLFQNGILNQEIEIDKTAIIGGNTNEWLGKFRDVHERDDNGNRYTYTVKEVIPTGYSEPEIDLIELTENFNGKDEPLITVTNKLGETPIENGKIKITKVDSINSNTKLDGATFKITNSVTKEVWLAESAPTAANGELTITDIPIGKYVLEEVKAPDGYELSTKEISFEVTADNATELQTFDFENTKTPAPTGKVSIKKYETGDTQKELIADAEFTLYKKEGTKETEVAKKTSVKGKELVFDELALGDYVLKETKAPAGYETATYEKTFTVTESALAFTYEVANTKTPAPTGKVTIKKHQTGDTDKTLIAGAEFTLTDSKGVAVNKTTKAGEELVFDNLAEGTYTLEETSSPAGYEKPEFKETFEVKDGVKLDFEYTVYNAKNPEPEKGKVTIKKYRDGDTTEALIADAEFTLYDADDKKISSQTTVEGKELVFDNLEYGKYTLKETKAPAGYEESTETKPVFEKEFEVTAADLNFEYKIANVPTPSRQTGKVSIKKYKDGDTTEALIGDAEFTLYDADGNEVAKKTTVKGEELVFDSLAYGKYTLKETKAPAGYEESTEAKPVFEKEFEVAAGELSFEYKVANKEIPEIQTSARDGETGTNEGYADEKVTIIDEVKYENLTIGKKYTVKGTLMDQATNQPFLTKDGKEVHAETSFDAEKTSGTVELTFVITNGDLQGKTVVVFEDLETEGKKVATHSDITDEKQSVDYPKVGTQASKSTKDDKITVTDIVSYEKLTVGKEYTVKGTLMDKETGKAFEVDGKAVTAETPFKPAAENGTTEVTFEFDKSAIEGKEISLVVFEKVLNADGKVIGTHEDLEDSAQTVEFKPDTPVIETSAKDSETGTNEGNGDEKVTIIDTVTYKNLTIGKDYTVKGVLMDKATNQPFLTKDGKEVHAEKDFTADKSNGTIDLEFVITNGDLAGKTVVVFETLYREGVEVAVHADIEDKNQSVDYPKVGTKASKSFAGDTITVTDIVSYEKLTVGKEYTVKGTLMDKETGKAFEVDGKAVTAEAPFTPTEENGITEVTFEFDRKAIEGKEISLVVFEKVLNADGKVIGTHEDLEDSEQTVDFNPDTPEISTTAKDSETGTNEGYADEKVSIIDTVHYDNLTIGKTYTVSGVLMDKATNQPFLTKEGKEVRAEKEFVPDATNGSVDLEFVITNGDLQGKTVVVFETLYRDGKEVAAHTDIEDKDQSVDYPKVGTKASEKTVGDKIVVTDIVAYEKLTVGKKYTVNGTLMDKATGKAFEVNGKAVTAEATFTPETENGTTEVSFEFAQKAIEGKEISLVVFEKVLNADGKVIGTHEDLEDPDQTVSFNPDTPEISTKAKDKGTASNEGQAKKDVTIIDEVSYRNLIVGKEYTVKGVLMDKATNQPLLANGKEVRAEKTFTAKKPNGTIELEFTFDGSALAGATVVVFETLYTDNKEVATHTDINDVDQTVTYPKVGTKASESTVDNTVVIKDIVSYENLVVGKKYTVKGVLMDKSTGLAYRVDGKKVLGETTFVAETASGTVEVAFEFAKSALTKKETLVVFEQLFNSKGYLVGTHEDINDKDQTVEVGDDTPGKPGLPSTNTKSGGRTYSYGTSTSRGSLPKTGSVTNPLFVILGLIIIGSAVTFYFVYIRRAKRNH